MADPFWTALAAISAAVPKDPSVWIALFGCAAVVAVVWALNSGTTQIVEGNSVVRSRIHAGGHSGPIPGRTHQTSKNNYIEDSDVTTGAGSHSASGSFAASVASAASARTRARK